MKTYQEMVAAKMENAKPVKEIDWSEFEGILDADLLADVKSTVATMQEEVLKKEHPIFKEFDQMAADFKVGVDGPGGLMEMARKREAAGSAGIEGIITELETLEKDIAVRQHPLTPFFSPKCRPQSRCGGLCSSPFCQPLCLRCAGS
jgi:hypothetical protein